MLKLIELLRQETDEQHPMLTSAVCGKLAAHGIPCDYRTLSRNIKISNDNGYEVMSIMVGHEKAYIGNAGIVSFDFETAATDGAVLPSK